MLEVRITEVSVTRMGFAIVLKPLLRNKVVPIFIGPLETYSISSALEGQTNERPLTHDLAKNIIERLDYRMVKVEVNDFRGGTFYARIFLSEKGNRQKLIELDSRPSDAIALAIRFDIPIFLSEEVYNKVAVEMSIMRDKKMEEAEELLTILEDNLPEEGVSDEKREEMIQSILEDFGEATQEPKAEKKEPDTYKTKEEVLEQMLKTAVGKENYEEAARIRDEISALRMNISLHKGKKDSGDSDQNRSN